MNDVIAFAPRQNSHGKHDATGAFQPHARRFLEAHGAPPENMHLVNIKRGVDRSAQVLDAIAAHGQKLICVAFFCHGFNNGIQFGFRSKTRSHQKANVDKLAAVLGAVGGTGLIVPLYCCSTASAKDKAPGGEGGFADVLRDELLLAGLNRARVDAHTTVGHTVTNPHVRRFSHDDPPGTGGQWLIKPGSTLWGTWKKALRDRKDDTRYAFPFWDSPLICRQMQRRLFAARNGME